MSFSSSWERASAEGSTGAVRASIGLATTFADVYKYVQFVESFVDKDVTG